SPAEPVMAAQPAAGESLARFNESAAVSNSQVQLLADAADWKVVVVKVGAVDRSDVKDRVGKVLQQHGLLLADAAPVAMPEWLAVVLSTDALMQQAVLLQNFANSVLHITAINRTHFHHHDLPVRGISQQLHLRVTDSGTFIKPC
ncbi:MAG: hypothetical protein ACKPHU_11385, partial [Planctomycetaceae bacterium]